MKLISKHIFPFKKIFDSQYSDNSLEVAALLTASGGFLDAFTYMGHGKVFANSMTGNIVFIGVYSVTGDWQRVLNLIPPIIAFLVGVFLAHKMRQPHNRKYLTSPALTCLFYEVVLLIIASFLPTSFPEWILVPSIALVAAMQNSGFTRIENWTYNSVMTTGNLRRFAEAFYQATLPGAYNKESMREAKTFAFICFCFFAGVVMGALMTVRLHNFALWMPILLLSIAFVICKKREKKLQ
ncbi:YoaK family protein [Chitinophagaceae bacterium LWZ2-11]